MADEQIQPGRYRHFKGKEYTVIGVAQHTETNEWLVIYRQEYGDHALLARPYEMFLEVVNSPEYDYIGPRFVFIADA